MITEELTRISGPNLELEGRLAYDDELPQRFLALVCAPHPLLAGTANSIVVLSLMRGLAEAGGVALSWSYRIRSAGEPDGLAERRAALQMDRCDASGMVVELEEAAACVAWLRRQRFLPEPADLLIAGYSFGAALGLHMAAPAQPVLAVSPPLVSMQNLKIESQAMTLVLPKDDFAATKDSVQRFLAGSTSRVQATFNLDDDHFLRRSSSEIQAIAKSWACAIVAVQSSASMPHASSLL